MNKKTWHALVKSKKLERKVPKKTPKKNGHGQNERSIGHSTLRHKGLYKKKTVGFWDFGVPRFEGSLSQLLAKSTGPTNQHKNEAT